MYYDSNPYFLHTSPSEPYLKTGMMTTRHSNRSREGSEGQSQRSCKVVRANGLRLVQKPVERERGSEQGTGLRLNEQTRRMMQREF